MKIIWLVGMLLAAGHVAADENKLAGAVEADVNGKRVVFSALSLDYALEIRGDVANVTVTQTFSNPLSAPVNARYLFPLNRRAAVHAMSMRIGNEITTAVIQEKQQAEATFAKAQQAGKSASLLTQHRPNMFTQRIANLMPGLPITVTIEYSQLVPKVDGDYELVVPMVVGPRFQPPGVGVPPLSNEATEQADNGRWQLEALPAYPPTAGVHIPRTVVQERVSLSAELEGQLPLSGVHSPTHPLALKHVSSTQVDLQLAAGRVFDNQDFVLRYAFETTTTDAGVLTHWQADEAGYFSLLIEPPGNVPAADVLKREMVFLLDCSGSMSGIPMQASKRFMTEALKGLRPDDTFRIIRFSDSATEFSRTPLPATPANIARGVQYAANLYGSGGTMMTEGIQQALQGTVAGDRVRNVVFLTDGYIGNEVSVLSLVEQLRGRARLFAFGVGSGVNRYLLDELGRVGRGFTRYFDPTQDDETVQAVAAELVARLQTPVLTDLEIDWGDLPVVDVTPRELPDLYRGQTVRVTGRYTGPAQGEYRVRGKGAQAHAELRRRVSFTEQTERPVLRQIWARETVADLNQLFISPRERRPDNMSEQQLQSRITDLGLTFGLVTRWTSFVAVSRRVYNDDPGSATDQDIPVPQVKGVSQLAYSAPVVGHAAPEPGIWLSLLAGLSVIGWLSWRRRLRN
ncbi:MAG: VIT domain-containing protein [Pseudomonadales bacterium]